MSTSAPPSLLAWPPSATEHVVLKQRLDSLKSEHRAMSKELLALHMRQRLRRQRVWSLLLWLSMRLLLLLCHPRG